jgi:hypothetical protein
VCSRGMLVHCLAAWVRQLPFWLLNSRVVTECLQRGQLNLAKPFIILMV